MKNIISIIKEIIILFCVFFTVGTLANTIGYLYFGWATNPDVHGHIMIRAGFTFLLAVAYILGEAVVQAFMNRRNKSTNLSD